MTIVAPALSPVTQPKKPSVTEQVIRRNEFEWRMATEAVLSYYESVERFVPVVERPDLGEAFRFRENDALPVFGWFNFKEGFTKRLADSVLDEFGYLLADGSALGDPFAGMATTLLTGALRQAHAIGVEVNPFFHWVASCKLNAHKVDVQFAAEAIPHILRLGAGTPSATQEWPSLTTFHTYYDASVLSTLIQLRDSIRHVVAHAGGALPPDVKQATEDFLLVGLAPIVEIGCELEKKGRGLKRRLHPLTVTPESVRSRLLQHWNTMLNDVQKLKAFGTNQPYGTAKLVKSSALDYQFGEQSLGLVLCSPPYCNSFDYSEVYKLELWFFQFVQSYAEWQALRKRTLRSHSATSFGRGFVNEAILPDALRSLTAYLQSDYVRPLAWTDYGALIRGYFDDISMVLKNLASGCKPGAKVVMVVGNSSYMAIPVATDLLIAEIAGQVGFRPIEIRVGRKLVTAGQQWRFTGDRAKRFLRESAVVLERI